PALDVRTTAGPRVQAVPREERTLRLDMEAGTALRVPRRVEGGDDKVSELQFGALLQEDVRFHGGRRCGKEPSRPWRVPYSPPGIDLENRDLRSRRGPDRCIVGGRIRMPVRVQNVDDFRAELLRHCEELLPRQGRIHDRG